MPGTLPGETVRARIARQARRCAGRRGRGGARRHPRPRRAALPAFRRPAAAAPCSIWADAPYAEWKRAKLVEALARAGFPDAPVGRAATHPAGHAAAAPTWRCGAARAAACCSASTAAARDAVTDLATCQVLDPRIVALFEPLRALLQRLAALRRDGSAVVNLLDTGPDLLLRTDGAAGRAGARPAGGLRQPSTASRASPGRRATACRRPRRSSARSASRSAAWRSRRRPAPSCRPARPARRRSSRPCWPGCRRSCRPRPRSPTSIAGLGTLSFPLAARARVTAFEGVADVGRGAGGRGGQGRARGCRRCGATWTASRLVAKELQGFAAVVLDPPFNGAAEQVPLLAQVGGAADHLRLLQPGGAGARRAGAGAGRLPGAGGDAGRPVPLVAAPGKRGGFRPIGWRNGLIPAQRLPIQ